MADIQQLREAIRRERVILEQLACAGQDIVTPDMKKVNATLDRLWIGAEDVLPPAARPDQPHVTTLREARNALRTLEAAVAAADPPPSVCAAPGPARPSWLRPSRRLTVEGEEVQIAVREAHSQFAVLDLLETAGWPADGAEVPHQMRRTLKNAVEALNVKLASTRLRLHRLENDHRIGWTVDPS